MPQQTDGDRRRALFDALFDYFGQHAKVDPSWQMAEFGIGKSGFGQFYSEKFARVLGIDIRDFSRFHPGVEFVISDGLTIPLKDRSLDMVASHSVLEHVGDLPASIAEIDRITRPGGYLFLTVTPLYFSGYGAHLHDEKGVRLEQWEHLDPRSPHYLISNPITGEPGAGHDLNGLTSSKFLSAIGTVPWRILDYEITFEKHPLAAHVDRSRYPLIDLVTKGFRFVGRKENMPRG